MSDTICEYLYLDEHRTTSYYEQLGKSVTYDKVPVYKTAVGLTALGVEATQTMVQRTATIYEKLRDVRNALSSSNQIVFARNYEGMEPNQYAPFREEVITASKVWIPARAGQDAYIDGPTIWVALAEWQTAKNGATVSEGSLYLLQNYHGDDNQIYKYLSPTSFMAELLRIGTDYTFRDTHGALPTAYHDIEYEMRTDPIGKLERLGAQIGQRRKIQCLYRIRTFYRERPLNSRDDYEPRPATFGYPLTITEESE